MCNMSDEMFRDASDEAKRATIRFDADKDVAAHLKATFDEKYKGSWYVDVIKTIGLIASIARITIADLARRSAGIACTEETSDSRSRSTRKPRSV